MMKMVLGTNNPLILSTAQRPLWWKAQKAKFSQDTLGKNVVQKLTNNPGMRTTELFYKTIELMKKNSRDSSAFISDLSFPPASIAAARMYEGENRPHYMSGFLSCYESTKKGIRWHPKGFKSQDR